MKKRKHKTTKNTMPRPPVTRLRVIEIDCNGKFTIVTDFHTQEEFDKVFQEWFDNPNTVRWCAETLIAYVNEKYPKRICMLQEVYDLTLKRIAIPATKEEWDEENN